MTVGGECRCGCVDPRGASVHRIVAALAVDDLDAAIDMGLLASDRCTGCSSQCDMSLLAARDARRAALAARDRFRARQARLSGRQQARLDVRAAADTSSPAPSLPPAAAAALQRAMAKAAGKRRK